MLTACEGRVLNTGHKILETEIKEAFAHNLKVVGITHFVFCIPSRPIYNNNKRILNTLLTFLSSCGTVI